MLQPPVAGSERYARVEAGARRDRLRIATACQARLWLQRDVSPAFAKVRRGGQSRGYRNGVLACNKTEKKAACAF